MQEEDEEEEEEEVNLLNLDHEPEALDAPPPPLMVGIESSFDLIQH